MTGAVITADLAIAQAKSSVAGIRIILVGIRISRIYSNAVTILKVEPGGYNPCVARLTSTVLESLSTRSSHISPMELGSNPDGIPWQESSR